MSDNRGSGLNLAGVVQVVFIILKLVKVVDWRWWVVFLPIELEVGIVALIGIVYLIRYLLKKLFTI